MKNLFVSSKWAIEIFSSNVTNSIFKFNSDYYMSIKTMCYGFWETLWLVWGKICWAKKWMVRGPCRRDWENDGWELLQGNLTLLCPPYLLQFSFLLWQTNIFLVIPKAVHPNFMFFGVWTISFFYLRVHIFLKSKNMANNQQSKDPQWNTEDVCTICVGLLK